MADEVELYVVGVYGCLLGGLTPTLQVARVQHIIYVLLEDGVLPTVVAIVISSNRDLLLLLLSHRNLLLVALLHILDVRYLLF